MSFSVEVSITPAAEIARKILNNVDEILDVFLQKRRHFMRLAGALVTCSIKEFLIFVISLNFQG